jgi:tRNA dimethylallyltransferase
MQGYAELPILTAQPSSAAMGGVPHRLYGVMSVRETCSAARWASLAWHEVDAAIASGLMPIVAGGTGLYLRTLMQGLAPVPQVPADVRETARELLKELGPTEFHARLAARDPDTAARIRPSDRQRLARAWEVLEATGRSLSAWQAGDAAGRPDMEFLTFILDPERKSLYAAIDRRFADMVHNGALEEARAIGRMALQEQLPALKALGLRELLDHLAGRTDLAAATAAAQQASRRYAKRQMTWFRHQVRSANFISDFLVSETSMERILPEILSEIRNSH